VVKFNFIEISRGTPSLQKCFHSIKLITFLEDSLKREYNGERESVSFQSLALVNVEITLINVTLLIK